MNPQVVDWNQDGYNDLIVGAGDGQIHYFRRQPGGSLTEMPVLFSYGDTLDLGNWAAPEVFDWNDDGLPDIIAGAGGGWLWLYLNTGTPGIPELAEGIPIQCAGYPIDLNYAYPGMADLDGDGLDDLIIGNYTGDVIWYRNEGSIGEPLFCTSVLLQSSGVPVDLGNWAKPYFADWNGDGYQDIVAGVYTGLSIRVYLADVTGISEQPGSQLDEEMTLELLGIPARGSFTAEVSISGGGLVEMSIYSIDGRTVTAQTAYDLNSGINQITVSTTGLPSGTYLFECRCDGQRVSRMLTILGD